MKSLKFFVCLAAIVAPFMSSCEKEDKGLSFDKNKVEIIISKTDKVNVSGGVAPYTVVSSDATIATAAISGKEITLSGIKKGNVSIVVTDKAGKKGNLSVSIIEDPYTAMKADPKTRFVWNSNSKIEGTDKGTYKFSQGTDGKVEFSWKSEDAKSTITLSFPSTAGSITEGVKTNAKLTIDGKDTQVTSLTVVQVKSVTVGDKNTVWIAFKADKKDGICVGKLQ